MNSKIFLILVVVLSMVGVVYGSSVNCWSYNTQATCINETQCRWDIWSQNCFEIGCWDMWEQDDCTNASALGLACTWKAEGSSGWCEWGAGCWEYQDSASCGNASGNCRWDGSAQCKEINCWDYDTETECDAHSSSNCLWDGWSCMETGGCMDYRNDTGCEAISGCMWKSDAYCSETGCWNYDNDQDGCDAATGCIWEEDEETGHSWCMKLDSCWSLS